MASIVSICNLALADLGKTDINDLSEPTAEARACNRFYNHTLDLLLQSYPWRFAGKTQALGELTNDKPGEWRHAYARPVTCLKVRWITPQYTTDDPCRATRDEQITIPYDIEGTVIYCNLSPAFLRFTQRMTDPAKFPSLFIEALACHLAVRLAMPLTRDPKVRADAYQLAMAVQVKAEAADANEVRETSDHASDIVESRG